MNIPRVNTTYIELKNNVLNKKSVKKIFTASKNIIPERKYYMQTRAFWKDPHNKKMAEISDMMMIYRDRLSARAIKLSDTYTQNIDGTLTKKPRRQAYAWVTAESRIYDSYKKTLKHYSDKMRTLSIKQNMQ